MHTDLAPALGDRGLFPSLTARAYLAHAAISPPSLAVERALSSCVTAYATRGALAFGQTVEQRVRLRSLLARLINADVEGVALVANTSTGVTDVALSLPWERGDRVILFEGEFPANVTPWQRAAELFGLELVWLSADEFRTDPTRAFESLDLELSRGARLVALSHVEFQTGLRMPLAEISSRAHRHGAEVFVDAIQGIGAVPLDVQREGVDYLASGSHKWLMGTEGCGVVYVRPSLASALRPYVAGWLSHEAPFRFLVEGAGHLRYDRALRPRADVFEVGTLNALGCHALEASVSLLLSLGVDAIYAHVNEYLDALEAGLIERGFTSLRAPSPEGRSCILGVTPRACSPWRATDLQRALGERGVVTSVPDGVLRFAPHWPNHVREVPEVLAIIDAVMAG